MQNYRQPINDPKMRIILKRKINRSFNRIIADRKRMRKQMMVKRWFNAMLIKWQGWYDYWL